MEIQGYKFSPTLEEIYQEITSTAPSLKLDFETVDEQPVKGRNAIQGVDPEGRRIIRIEKNSLNESVISHELLHCYLDLKGYPKLSTLCVENNIINYFAMRTEESIIHKLICQEQDKRGITRTDDLEYAKSISDDLEWEPMSPEAQIFYSMKILDILIRTSEWKEFYETSLRYRFKNSYQYAERLWDKVMSKDFQTPFETRRAMIRVLKELENIIAENGLEPLNLSMNVATGFIPSARQLDENIFDLFEVYKDFLTDPYTGEKVWVLVSKAEDQASFFVLPGENFEESLTDKTLRELYKEWKVSYTLR
ncbi:MAG: hypothetical protein GX207_05525 [Peptococcaceae bacterium]|nr:hypothetical protein [Peptococcaceae bacterium]